MCKPIEEPHGVVGWVGVVGLGIHLIKEVRNVLLVK